MAGVHAIQFIPELPSWALNLCIQNTIKYHPAFIFYLNPVLVRVNVLFGFYPAVEILHRCAAIRIEV